MSRKIAFKTDRVRNSTDNNEYSEGLRDETELAEELIDTEIPTDDMIPDGINETQEGDRPLYDEMG